MPTSIFYTGVYPGVFVTWYIIAWCHDDSEQKNNLTLPQKLLLQIRLKKMSKIIWINDVAEQAFDLLHTTVTFYF